MFSAFRLTTKEYTLFHSQFKYLRVFFTGKTEQKTHRWGRDLRAVEGDARARLKWVARHRLVVIINHGCWRDILIG